MRIGELKPYGRPGNVCLSRIARRSSLCSLSIEIFADGCTVVSRSQLLHHRLHAYGHGGQQRTCMQSLLARICGKNAAACKVHATETDCLNNALPSKTSAPTPDPAPTADSSSLIHGERGSPYAAVSRCEVGVSPQTRETRCMHGEPQSQPQPSCAVES